MPTSKILRKGILAYYDSFSGFILCKVLSVNSNGRAEIEITVSRGAYRKGEILEFSTLNVVPRSAVKVKCGQFRILKYKIIPDKGE